MKTRIAKLEQHPAIKEAKQQKFFVALSRMKSREFNQHLDSMTDAQLDAFISHFGADDGMSEVDFDAVPDVALDAFIDGELTWDELKERYPAEVTP